MQHIAHYINFQKTEDILHLQYISQNLDLDDIPWASDIPYLHLDSQLSESYHQALLLISNISQEYQYQEKDEYSQMEIELELAYF